MPAAEFSALLLFASAMSFTPGPNTTLSAALAADGGVRRALRFVVAVPVGWSAMLALSALGVGAAVDAMPALRGAVKALGIGYMLWLAWQIGRRRPGGAAGGRRLEVGFAQGIVLQFVNLKAWLAALTISAGWIAVPGEVGVRLAQVLPAMVAFGLVGNFAYALLGASLRRLVGDGERLLWVNRALALLLAATALWMLRL